MVRGKEDADTRGQVHGETKDFVSLHETRTVGVKLNRGNVEGVE
jgi:hypothetical protein